MPGNPKLMNRTAALGTPSPTPRQTNLTPTSKLHPRPNIDGNRGKRRGLSAERNKKGRKRSSRGDTCNQSRGGISKVHNKAEERNLRRFNGAFTQMRR